MTGSPAMTIWLSMFTAFIKDIFTYPLLQNVIYQCSKVVCFSRRFCNVKQSKTIGIVNVMG